MNSINIRVRKNHWAPFWASMGSMWYFVEVLRFRWYLGRNILYFHALTFNVVATTAGRCHYHRTRIYSYFVAGIPIFVGSYPLVNMEVAVPRYSPNIAWMVSYQDPAGASVGRSPCSRKTLGVLGFHLSCCGAGQKRRQWEEELERCTG